ncbi:hypothetical protein FB451DRAFT_1553146 [Mycena latifolia]|nr:hypothetical protein FB451DRAFT_1553146 [Mycena latifolia]
MLLLLCAYTARLAPPSASPTVVADLWYESAAALLAAANTDVVQTLLLRALRDHGCGRGRDAQAWRGVGAAVRAAQELGLDSEVKEGGHGSDVKEDSGRGLGRALASAEALRPLLPPSASTNGNGNASLPSPVSTSSLVSIYASTSAPFRSHALPIPEGTPSNPHMSFEIYDEVFVPDLGGDKIWRITASTLTAQVIPDGPNGTALPLLANVTTIPADVLPSSKFAAAELLISTPTDAFPTPLLYFVNGTEHDQHPPHDAPTHAPPGRGRRAAAPRRADPQQIQSMALGRADNGGAEFIIAGTNTEGGVAVFQRVDGGINLTLALAARNFELGNRTSFVFVESGSA